jgi:hypothetical protein
MTLKIASILEVILLDEKPKVLLHPFFSLFGIFIVHTASKLYVIV